MDQVILDSKTWDFQIRINFIPITFLEKLGSGKQDLVSLNLDWSDPIKCSFKNGHKSKMDQVILGSKT